MKNMKEKKYINIFLIIITLIFILMGLNNNVVSTYYEIYDQKINDDFKIVFISDTHSCKYGNNQRELLRKIEDENPDLIFLGGDIIDDELPMKIGFDTIKDLPNISTTFYVTGNHEIMTNEYEDIKNKIRSFGIEVLEGEAKDINIKNNKITILGIDDPDIGSLYDRELLNLMNKKFDNLSLLIAHRPERLDDYKKLDIDYVFSGHAHGGQWRIPFILERGLYAPNQGLFPKYTFGVNKIDDFSMIISRGLSRESTKIPRIYNKPEIVVINFKAK